MIRRAWLGLKCLLLVAALGAAASPSDDRRGSNQGQAAKTVAQPFQPIAGPLDPADKVPSLERPCKQSEDDRQSDLCAQWKAADAAAASTQWAAWSFYLACAGTAIGFLTLAAAGAAAFFAKAAADETKRGADAAAESVELAKDIGRRQLRAYVLVETTKIAIDGTGYGGAVLTFKNSGQTPAIDVVIRCNVERRVVGVPIEFNDPAPAAVKSKFSLAPQGMRDKKVGPWDPGSIAILQKGAVEVFVWGQIFYSDIFGTKHWSKFRLYSGGDHGFLKGQALMVSAEGNYEDND